MGKWEDCSPLYAVLLTQTVEKHRVRNLGEEASVTLCIRQFMLGDSLILWQHNIVLHC